MIRSSCVIALAAFSSLFAVACSCTEVGCAIGGDQGVSVEVKGVITAYSGSLPVTLHLCVEDTCGDFTLKDENGEIVCDDHQAEDEPDTSACFLGDEDVELVLSADMPGSTADVHLTVEDSAGMQLFDDTATVTVNAYEPNGAMCGPSCRTATATFTADAASQ